MPLGIQKLQAAKETKRQGAQEDTLSSFDVSVAPSADKGWTLCRWQRRKGNIEKQCQEGGLWSREAGRALGSAVLKYPCVKAALIYFGCCVILFLGSWGSLFCVIIQCTGCYRLCIDASRTGELYSAAGCLLVSSQMCIHNFRLHFAEQSK